MSRHASIHIRRSLLKTIDIENSSEWSGMFVHSRKRKAAVAVNLKSATESLRRLMSVAFGYSCEKHTSKFINVSVKRNGSEFKCFEELSVTCCRSNEVQRRVSEEEGVVYGWRSSSRSKHFDERVVFGHIAESHWFKLSKYCTTCDWRSYLE